MSEKAKLKLCIFGDGGVGKTSLTQRYLTQVFDEDLKMTIGTDLCVKDVNIDNLNARLQIWDFAGEERYKVLFPSFVKGAHGGIFMFDVTRHTTLKNLDGWLSFFKEEMEATNKHIPIIMVGSKLDLGDNRSISTEDGIEIARSSNLQGYFECSAKTGENIDNIFENITRLMLMEEGLIEKNDIIG
ncbi:MAG: Rab family GTPase [Candidatus Heimdallarchaeota archaeon]